MGWRVDLLDWMQEVANDLNYNFFGTWNNQSDEEKNDMFHVENALLLNLDYSEEYISYNSSQDNFALERQIDFSLFVCVKNKDFNIEKHREIFTLCDELEVKIMQQDSPFSAISFTGESPVLPHSEFVIREQKYTIMILETHEKNNKPIPSQIGDITNIERNFCIKK